MMSNKKKHSSNDSWTVAKRRYNLSADQIEMAKKLGLNPKKFGRWAPNKSEPWKEPLGDCIERFYNKRFNKK